MILFRSLVEQVLLPSLLLLLFIGSVFAIFVGAGLILRGPAMFRFFGTMNRWVSTRRALKPVEIPRDTNPILLRWPRLIWVVFTLAAGVSLIVLIRQFDVGAIVALFQRQAPAVAVELVATSLKWLLVAGNALAVVIGIALVLYPDALTRLEPRMNQWYSPRASGKDLDRVHLALDDWVEAHPRAAGWIILVLAVFVVVNLGAIQFGRVFP